MTVYLDLVFILNFLIDLLLLITTTIVLKRRVKIKRLILGAIFGSISLLFLFIKTTTLLLFFFKIIIAIIMVLIVFGYKGIRYTLNNILYLYLISIIYGGFLYFLKIEFAYKNNGLIFYNNGLSLNFIIILLISPLILYFYLKSNRKIKQHYSNYYEISIYINNEKKNLTAYLDTGNNLYDPYLKRPIILVNPHLFNLKNKKFIMTPYHDVSSHGLLKCYKPDKIVVENRTITNVLIATLENKINIDGVDCILHKDLI